MTYLLLALIERLKMKCLSLLTLTFDNICAEIVNFNKERFTQVMKI